MLPLQVTYEVIPSQVTLTPILKSLLLCIPLFISQGSEIIVQLFYSVKMSKFISAAAVSL